jgi:hypothetical protein
MQIINKTKQILKSVLFNRKLAFVTLIGSGYYQMMGGSMRLDIAAGFAGMWALFVLLFT